MRASVGDRIIIRGHHVGEHDRDGEVLEVRGPDGTAPFVVRWEDTGHVSLFFPGPDAAVQHFVHEDRVEHHLEHGEHGEQPVEHGAGAPGR